MSKWQGRADFVVGGDDGRGGNEEDDGRLTHKLRGISCKGEGRWRRDMSYDGLRMWDSEGESWRSGLLITNTGFGFLKPE